MSEAELLRKAQTFLRLAEDEALDQSPLGNIAQWLATGDAPPLAALQSQGFVPEALNEEEYSRLRLVRRAFVRRFGFSIPCKEAADALCNISPLLEVGAGTGYWSQLLAARGADIVATDANKEQYGFTTAALFPVVHMDAVEAVRTFPGRSLFCSWPTKDANWLTEAVEALPAGIAVAIIGGDRGGETGGSSLFDLLEELELYLEIPIPSFPGEHDKLRLYSNI